MELGKLVQEAEGAAGALAAAKDAAQAAEASVAAATEKARAASRCLADRYRGERVALGARTRVKTRVYTLRVNHRLGPGAGAG